MRPIFYWLSLIPFFITVKGDTNTSANIMQLCQIYTDEYGADVTVVSGRMTGPCSIECQVYIEYEYDYDYTYDKKKRSAENNNGAHKYSDLEKRSARKMKRSVDFEKRSAVQMKRSIKEKRSVNLNREKREDHDDYDYFEGPKNITLSNLESCGKNQVCNFGNCETVLTKYNPTCNGGLPGSVALQDEGSTPCTVNCYLAGVNASFWLMESFVDLPYKTSCGNNMLCSDGFCLSASRFPKCM